MTWGGNIALPKAIVHIDGDSFFASCEIAMDPSLRGKPIVTGAERGIVSSMSYEARNMGIRRAMPIHEIKAKFPQVIIRSSDYGAYSMFSRRMYAVVRRYTPIVEEYSIDECFADLTGLRRALRMPYEDMVRRIKADLRRELNMTFSVGLAPTKVLAKIASPWDKPDGLTIIKTYDINDYLKRLPIAKVWGIGYQTSAYLAKYNIKTAYDFVKKGELWVNEYVTKPHQEIWSELQGISINDVAQGDYHYEHTYQSISKTQTFTPSTNHNYIFTQLSKNVENACIKMRRYNLEAYAFEVFIKDQKFRYYSFECKLDIPSDTPEVLLAIINENFDKVYNRGITYRATGVTLNKLRPKQKGQLDLWGDSILQDRRSAVHASVDKLNEKYGTHTVYMASSIQKMTHKNVKKIINRKKIGIPLLGQVT